MSKEAYALELRETKQKLAAAVRAQEGYYTESQALKRKVESLVEQMELDRGDQEVLRQGFVERGQRIRALEEQLEAAREAERQALVAHGVEKQAKHNVEAELRGLREQLEATQRELERRTMKTREARVTELEEQNESLLRDNETLGVLNKTLKEQLEASQIALGFIRQWAYHPDRTEAIYQIRERFEEFDSNPTKVPAPADRSAPDMSGGGSTGNEEPAGAGFTVTNDPHGITKMPAFENREELPLVDVEPIEESSPASESDPELDKALAYIKRTSNQERSPASMFAPCEKCGRSSEGVRRETVEQGEVVRPGFKCECGWWNWLDSPPSNQEHSPASEPELA